MLAAVRKARKSLADRVNRHDFRYALEIMIFDCILAGSHEKLQLTKSVRLWFITEGCLAKVKTEVQKLARFAK